MRLRRWNFRVSKKVAIIFTIITLFFVLFNTNFSQSIANADNSHSAQIVMDANTYEVIFGENIHARLPMASTTKIMTALVIIENCNLNDLVTIDDRAIGVEGSSVYLEKGEKLKVKDLLLCLMLRSGNDSAVALALHLCNSLEKFAMMMNSKVEELGLKNTNFTNPHGLHDDNHYTSAYDLAVISSYAMKNQDFINVVSTKNVKITSNYHTRYLSNKNKILTSYEGANGIKTGFTKKAGRCLVASAKRNQKQVVSVVLNVSDTYGTCKTLMDKAFEK